MRGSADADEASAFSMPVVIFTGIAYNGIGNRMEGDVFLRLPDFLAPWLERSKGSLSAPSEKGDAGKAGAAGEAGSGSEAAEATEEVGSGSGRSGTGASGGSSAVGVSSCVGTAAQGTEPMMARSEVGDRTTALVVSTVAPTSVEGSASLGLRKNALSGKTWAWAREGVLAAAC